VTLLLTKAAELQRFLDDRHWANCIIGGLAVQRWGEIRLTRDIDCTLLTGFGEEEKYVDALLERYKSRVSDPRSFALSNRVVLLQTSEGVGIDIALGAMPFEQKVMKRASAFAYATSQELRTCSAEDLVVMKAFAGRGIDWHDARGVLIRQKDRLDWRYILSELRPLAELKESPETVTQLEKLRKEVAAL
jgi:hypothetical protein